MQDLVGHPADLRERLALVRVREHDRGVGVIVVRGPLRAEYHRRRFDIRHKGGEDRRQAATRGSPVALVNEWWQPAGEGVGVVVGRQAQLFQVVLARGGGRGFTDTGDPCQKQSGDHPDNEHGDKDVSPRHARPMDHSISPPANF